MQKKRKPHRGPCKDKRERRKERVRNGKRAAKRRVGTFFVVFRVKGTHEDGSDVSEESEFGPWCVCCWIGLR